jgi:hypothetical protein
MFPCSLALLALAVQAAPQESLGPAKDLKILYAGAPDEVREERFLTFLEAWFTHVDPMPLTELDAKSAAPYDVVILDWKRQYKNGMPVDGADAPLKLSASFAKPVIMLGANAATVQHHSKIDWL